MNYTMNKENLGTNKVSWLNYYDKIEVLSAEDEIYEGLRAEKKFISPKYFYNELGSELFEQITHLKEYYPSRTEKKLLAEVAPLLSIDFNGINIMELGSGDSSKITILLEHLSSETLASIHYYPMDISFSAIEKAVKQIEADFTLKAITAIVADFVTQLKFVPKIKNRLFCFFGSTIGNLNVQERNLFLQELALIMEPGDYLLIGMDNVKNKSVLEAAYNDSMGITADFNKNILSVCNKIVGTHFNTEDFDHYAFYNEDEARIEMHLRANKDINTRIKESEETLFIRKGNTIHTENSHKFSLKHIESMASTANLQIKQVFQDEKKWFSLVLFTK